MAESNTNPAAEPILKSVQTAHQIQGAVKTGKAIAGMAKGAAAGGPYGAIAGLAWENRKTIAKAAAAIALVLAIPILFILMLPSLIFGDLSSTEVSDVMNDDTAIVANEETAQTVINDCINQSHNDILSKINDEISSQPEGTTARIEDSFVGSVIMDTNTLISQYCASKDKRLQPVPNPQEKHLLLFIHIRCSMLATKNSRKYLDLMRRKRSWHTIMRRT